MSQKNAAVENRTGLRVNGPGLFLLIIGSVLAVLFWRSFDPAWVQFANDGPLGFVMAEHTRVPATFTGAWNDLNGYGIRDTGAMPSLSFVLYWLLGPLGFAKFFPPLALLILGVGTWFFIRQLGLGTLAAVLVGLVAPLSPAFFGTACWGVGPQAICFGLNYAAIGIVVSAYPLRPWVRYPLAGMVVGMGVMEAFDIGAIFSVFTAIFVVFHALITSGSVAKGIVLGGLRVGTIAVFAGFIAAAAVFTLVGTQIKGVTGTQQDERTKAERWDFATQWSVPKIEILGFGIPGLFGYRMETPNGGAYWGRGGRDPAWERYYAGGKQGPPPQGPIRYGGGGGYMGVLVLLTAFWAVLQSLRKVNSVFDLTERRIIWFWVAIAIGCLLLMFGRFAPFYQFFYALPYASTIRNPAKFGHVLQWSVVIIFAYGIGALSRTCLQAGVATSRGLVSQLQTWWAKAPAFDKRWVKGGITAIILTVTGWIGYSSMREKLVAYLQEVQFDEATANAIATFSFGRVGWFALILSLAVGLFTLILSGYFAGKRARVAVVLLGVFIVLDLTQVGINWVVPYNWKERYLEAADNPIINYLRQRPFENRVAIAPGWLSQVVRVEPSIARAHDILRSVYGTEWTQHLFQYYNIQTLDIVQMPRVPEDINTFETAMHFTGTQETVHRVSRRWQLTDTRYIVCAAGLYNALPLLDPGQQRFRPLMLFEFFQERAGGPILTRTNVSGQQHPLALIEFTGALPRAKLYSRWQINTNDQDTLSQLASKEFNPEQSVFVAETLPSPTATDATNSSAGTVEFKSYAPKRIVLQAKAETSCVLLLNDKHDPNWKVTVDGKPVPLLRCNYIMRGVHLEQGGHTVEFRFVPPTDSLYVSLAAIGLGMILIGLTIVSRKAMCELGNK